MNVFQIVLKTIITTIDLLLSLIVLRDENNPDGAKRVLTVLVIANLMGVWI